MSPEKIHELTEEGVMPHYKLIDPFNGNQVMKYYYRTKDVENFIIKNCLISQDLTFEPEYKFVNFCTGISTEESAQIPIELSNLSQMYVIRTDQMLATCGIYFLCKEKKIVYIGQSTSIATRLAVHIEEAAKQFDLCVWIPIHKRDLDTVEASLIKHFKPKLNKAMFGGNSQPHERAIVASILQPEEKMEVE